VAVKSSGGKSIPEYFVKLLDERFERVHTDLKRIEDGIKEQNETRDDQFAALEKKVDAADARLRTVGGVSAGAGGVIGVAVHWLWAKLTGSGS
jgi:hypothetical protein